MPTTGQFIRERLVAAAEKGVVIADLHKERKANWRELGLTYKAGTYSSFCRLFFFLEQLNWVERTSKTETAFAKGSMTELLIPRTYYRITDEGLSHLEIDWMDPLSAKYPELTGSARATKYRLPYILPVLLVPKGFLDEELILVLNHAPKYSLDLIQEKHET
ncbi:unnamed protein product [marine sediment metagenome]|uniref:Uncharacterized protein n=1 Tax=marine sediment metagenome TaxID=412755 RepID=X1TV59_9ZZZZ